MKKKIVLVVGIIVLISSLFFNLIASEYSDTSDLSLSNIEAISTEEGSDGTKEPTCIESGTICVGIDKNGISGYHSGLMINTKQ